MIITASPIAGAYLIDIEAQHDARGFFARIVCRDEFTAHGLAANFVQQSLSWNAKRATLRGLHWQAAPHGEVKLVRAVRGALYDVIVDLRPDSPGYGRWFGVELNEENRRAIYIPPGCAHGFQTLRDDTELLYQMTVPYCAEAARGLRWNDAHLAIRWPLADEAIVSARDAALPCWPPSAT